MSRNARIRAGGDGGASGLAPASPAEPGPSGTARAGSSRSVAARTTAKSSARVCFSRNAAHTGQARSAAAAYPAGKSSMGAAASTACRAVGTVDHGRQHGREARRARAGAAPGEPQATAQRPRTTLILANAVAVTASTGNAMPSASHSAAPAPRAPPLASTGFTASAPRAPVGVEARDGLPGGRRERLGRQVRHEPRPFASGADEQPPPLDLDQKQRGVQVEPASADHVNVLRPAHAPHPPRTPAKRRITKAPPPKSASSRSATPRARRSHGPNFAQPGRRFKVCESLACLVAQGSLHPPGHDHAPPPAARPRQALALYAVTLAVTVGLTLASEVFGALRGYLLVLVAATFLYLPIEVLHRTGEDPEDFGIHRRGLLRALRLAGLWMLFTFPIYLVGFHVWQTQVLHKHLRPEAARFDRWPVELEDAPLDPKPPREGEVRLWVDNDKLSLQWKLPLGQRLEGKVEGTPPATVSGGSKGFERFDVRGNFVGIDLQAGGDRLPPDRLRLGAAGSAADDVPYLARRSFFWLLNLILVQLLLVALPEEVFYRGYLQTRFDTVLSLKNS